jgi:hypothetical protein
MWWSAGVATSMRLKSDWDSTFFKDVKLFLPYDAIPAEKDGKARQLKIVIRVWSEVFRDWIAVPVVLEHSFTLPAQAPVVAKTNSPR